MSDIDKSISDKYLKLKERSFTIMYTLKDDPNLNNKSYDQLREELYDKTIHNYNKKEKEFSLDNIDNLLFFKYKDIKTLDDLEYSIVYDNNNTIILNDYKNINMFNFDTFNVIIIKARFEIPININQINLIDIYCKVYKDGNILKIEFWDDNKINNNNIDIFKRSLYLNKKLPLYNDQIIGVKYNYSFSYLSNLLFDLNDSRIANVLYNEQSEILSDLYSQYGSTFSSIGIVELISYLKSDDSKFRINLYNLEDSEIDIILNRLDYIKDNYSNEFPNVINYFLNTFFNNEILNIYEKYKELLG